MRKLKCSYINFVGFFVVLLIVCALIPESMAATLIGHPTFGSPDQAFATRRPVTQADRAEIQSYLNGDTASVFSANFGDKARLTSDWDLVSDDPSTLKSCRRPENDTVGENGLVLKIMPATYCHNHSAIASTGSMISKKKFGYGFYEARMKISNVSGVNNAFWLTTDDNYEIDIAEVHYPNIVDLTLHRWPGSDKNIKHVSVGFVTKFNTNLSQAFHDYGVLWTPSEILFEVDGVPVAAVMTNNYIKGPAEIRLSTAITSFAGVISGDPEGHDTIVQSLKVYRLH